jgi:hypothetical protein
LGDFSHDELRAQRRAGWDRDPVADARERRFRAGCSLRGRRRALCMTPWDRQETVGGDTNAQSKQDQEKTGAGA